MVYSGAGGGAQDGLPVGAGKRGEAPQRGEKDGVCPALA